MALIVPSIPVWLGSASPELYKRLTQGFTSIKTKATVLPADETNWNTQLSTISTSLANWKSADRKKEFLEFTGVALSFQNLCERKGLNSIYSGILGSIQYDKIFNFQGLETACKSWNSSHLLNYTNLSATASLISTSRTYEQNLMASLKNQMIDIIQTDSFRDMIKSDILRPYFFDAMHFDKAAILNLGNLDVSKPT